MSGVSHLHSLGIVHGDLSLSNLLVSSTGVKVADMNTANSAHDFIVPESWNGMCTSYVKAPELFKPKPTSSTKVDVWSLGVVTLCLSTGV